jgi:CheY-like chemotaxis protein
MHILLVEDDVSNATLLARLLVAMGHTVIVAGSAASALAAAALEKFEYVVCDIGLPDANGHDLMRQLVRLYHLEGVAVSGYGTAADRTLSLAAGFSRHLSKPIRMHELEAALKCANHATEAAS